MSLTECNGQAQTLALAVQAYYPESMLPILEEIADPGQSAGIISKFYRTWISGWVASSNELVGTG